MNAAYPVAGPVSRSRRELLRQFLERGRTQRQGGRIARPHSWSNEELSQIAQNLLTGLLRLQKAWQRVGFHPPAREIEAALLSIQSLDRNEQRLFFSAIPVAVNLQCLAIRIEGKAFSRFPAWQAELLELAGAPAAEAVWQTVNSWMRIKHASKKLSETIAQNELRVERLEARLRNAIQFQFDRASARTSIDLPPPLVAFERIGDMLSGLEVSIDRAIRELHRSAIRPSIGEGDGLIFDLSNFTIKNEDVHLVTTWMIGPNSDPINLSEEYSRSDQRRIVSLFAARLAERCVHAWLARDRYFVEDLSILQVREPARAEWIIGDLRTADGAVFDVKNTIRFPGWIETRINRTKKVPNGTHVVYVATHTRLDPDKYAWGELREGGSLPAKTAIMGTATRQAMNELRTWSIATTPKVRLGGGGSDDIWFAPFYFHLPDAGWPEPQRAIRDAAIQWAKVGWTRFGLKSPAPVALAAGLPTEAVAGDATLLALYDWFSNRLVKMPTLGGLYCVLLDHFIQHYANGRVTIDHREIDASSYRELLLPEVRFGDARRLPAWQWDPTGMVNRAISAISSLLQATVQIPAIRQLRMTMQGVVSADVVPTKEIESSAVTLLAHCGDCGTFPLIFGREPTCSGCGRLLCTRWEQPPGCTCGKSTTSLDAAL